MKDEPVYRPEFEIFMKMSSEREERTTIAIESMVEENKKNNSLLNTTNDLLTDYIHKHDNIETRVNKNSDDIKDLQQIALDSKKVTDVYSVIKKGLAWIIGGLLTTAGAILAYDLWG